VRDNFFNELPVGACQAAWQHVRVPNQDLAAFPEKLFDELNLRAFSEVIRPGLKAEAKDSYLSLTSPQDGLDSPIDVFGIAGEYRLEQG
jgi:hypothetical protein